MRKKTALIVTAISGTLLLCIAGGCCDLPLIEEPEEIPMETICMNGR